LLDLASKHSTKKIFSLFFLTFDLLFQQKHMVGGSHMLLQVLIIWSQAS